MVNSEMGGEDVAVKKQEARIKKQEGRGEGARRGRRFLTTEFTENTEGRIFFTTKTPRHQGFLGGEDGPQITQIAPVSGRMARFGVAG